MRRAHNLAEKLARPSDESGPLRLEDGSRVAVIGGGPAGSFFSLFLLRLAANVGIDVRVDLYEPRHYTCAGPGSCNHCGGIISESLVQLLATEGINLPPSIVRRGIDSYVLHTDIGSVRLETPLHEKRIAAVYRGAGPRGSSGLEAGSFDRYLQDLAVSKGARLLQKKVGDLCWEEGRPVVTVRGDLPRSYDLLVGAVGVNGAGVKMFQNFDPCYEPPATTKTFICEFLLGEDKILEHMGTSMHVFLLNLPRLEFAAFIPKGDYLTLCLLGESIDKELVKAFLDTPEVRAALPPDVDVSLPDCKCSPKIAIRRAVQPYRDRAVLIGDCGVTRLYKDGIGAAYRTAKAAANTAVLQGISEQAFHDHYWKACMAIDRDNAIGKGIFMLSRVAQSWRVARRAMLRMVSAEQHGKRKPVMSTIVWDMFTGSAPYKEIFLRGLNPVFLARLAGNTVAGMFPTKIAEQEQEAPMKTATLGKAYRDGESIVREGEVGDCMYVIQAGSVEVVQDAGPHEVRLAVLEEGDFFGEMAIFERQARSATVRARGEANVLTVDKRTLLRRFQEDPSLAFRMVETMSHRVREMDTELTRLKSGRA